MFKKSEIETQIDDEILTLLAALRTAKDPKEHAEWTDQLTKLYELRQKNRISMETLATIGANLTGIIVILSHERAHVIASKAFGLVKKLF